MAFVIGFAGKGIAMGVGLASEGIHAHKEKKKRAKELGQAQNVDASDSTVHLPDESQLTHDSLDGNRADYEGDEAHWNLDEVQDEVQPSTPKEEKEIQKHKRPERNITVIIDEFVAKYPLPNIPAQGTPLRNLALPVILPQRRPKGRSRGFIRAYSPVLMDCGIDQPMFIDFLDTFNTATLASPWIQLLNLAGIAGNIIPSHLGIVLQVAIYITIKTAEEMQGRSRTNTYLDGLNKNFFRPRGLFCLVLTWIPESPSTQMSVDTNTLIASSLEPKHGFDKFHTSNGNTYGDFEFPEAAPLVFPAIDEMAVHEGGEAVTKRAKMKKASEFTSDYLDRRARAAYAAEHPGSLLAQGPKDKFTSRYADPTHPASSGNPWSLITGGKFNPPMGQGLGGMLNELGGRSGSSTSQRGLGGGQDRGLGGFGGGFGSYGRGRMGMGYGGLGWGDAFQDRQERMNMASDSRMNAYQYRQDRMGMGFGYNRFGGGYPENRYGGGYGRGQGMGYGPEYQDPRYSGGMGSMGMRDVGQNPEMRGANGGMGSRDIGPDPGMGARDMGPEPGMSRMGPNPEMGGMGMGGMGGNPLAFGGLAPIGKAFKKIIGRNVLYLMIVNMPTEEEMAAAVATADQKGWSTGSGVSPSQAARYAGPQSTTYHPWTRSESTLEEWRHQAHSAGNSNAGTPMSEKEQNSNRPTPQYQPGNYQDTRAPEKTPLKDPPDNDDATSPRLNK